MNHSDNRLSRWREEIQCDRVFLMKEEKWVKEMLWFCENNQKVIWSSVESFSWWVSESVLIKVIKYEMCVFLCVKLWSQTFRGCNLDRSPQEERRQPGDRGEEVPLEKTERGADRSRLHRAKNVSQFSWRNLNCPGGPFLSAQGGY